VIVEAIRLLVTLATTAAGFTIGASWNSWFPSASVGSDASVVGALIGAGVGYVLGGILGRLIRRGLDAPPKLLAKASGPELFAGAFGLMLGVLLGALVGLPIVVLLPDVMAWPVAILIVLVMGTFGAKVFAERSHELLSAAGLRQRDPLRRRLATPADEPGDSYLIDSSAAIDGRILELARSGLMAGSVWVPSFVVDELQSIADSGDKSRRRRGRRGLDFLDALRDVPSISFAVIEETVPEALEVDAKLLALAARSQASLVTTDHNLSRAAGLRGIAVVNPHAIGESLRPALGAGDELSVLIEKAGSESGQGVGFLDDGTMVVVSDAGDSIGKTLSVEVSNMLRTSVGRMLFARYTP
jgi:uncharacterized protein YacL